VAALCARGAVRGAYLNVRINVKDLDDPAAVNDFLRRGENLVSQAEALETEILELVEKNLQ